MSVLEGQASGAFPGGDPMTQEGKAISEQQAQALVNSLVDSDARFPQAARQDLFGWARSQHPPLL
jgi:hypothetical protein